MRVVTVALDQGIVSALFDNAPALQYDDPVDMANS
jgi:hypothetical protein